MPKLSYNELELKLKKANEKISFFEKQIENKRTFLELAEQLPVAIVEMNLKMEVVYMNNATEVLFGYELEEVKGKKVIDFMLPEDRNRINENISSIFKGIYGTPNKYTAVSKDKRKFDILISSAPFLCDGKPAGVRSCIVDYTHYCKIEEEKLVKANKETKKAYKLADKLKKELVFHTSLGKMISNSLDMIKLFKDIKMISNLPTTVLISGETGVGKEVVAKQIHESSNRKDAPLICINCSALPENLIESELFGYLKGAFTDAKEDKKGLFEQANGGTIFLDEIGDMPLTMQAKLLRVLQEDKIMPLGSFKEIKTNTRIIAATNKDLEKLVEEKRFREDLYYRIKVVHLTIPPLRDRKVDIPILVNHFIEHYNTVFSKKIRKISDQAKNMLLKYDFPGNVRELKHIIEYACIFCENNIIDVNNFAEDFKSKVLDFNNLSEKDQFLKKKKQLIHDLKVSGGNKSKAARKLGVHKTTIFRHLKKYNISDDMIS